MVLFRPGVQAIITFVLPGGFFKITNGSSHKSQRQKRKILILEGHFLDSRRLFILPLKLRHLKDAN